MAERFINLFGDGLQLTLLGRVVDVQVQQIHRWLSSRRVDHEQPDTTPWPRPITIPGAMVMDGKSLKPRGQRNKSQGKRFNSRGI